MLVKRRPGLPKVQKISYDLDEIRIAECVYKNDLIHLPGLLRRASLGQRIPNTIIELLEKAHTLDPSFVCKIRGDYIIGGNTLDSNEWLSINAHVLIVQENDYYVRGSRSDDVFREFKVLQHLMR